MAAVYQQSRKAEHGCCMIAAGSLAALHHQMSGPGSGKDNYACVVAFVNLRDVSTFWCLWLTLA